MKGDTVKERVLFGIGIVGAIGFVAYIAIMHTLAFVLMYSGIIIAKLFTRKQL